MTHHSKAYGSAIRGMTTSQVSRKDAMEGDEGQPDVLGIIGC